MNKKINYLETFLFPDIDIIYPVYAVSESGRVMNFKSVIYPNPRSRKRFTRRKQLCLRSGQAKIFDALINVGYFDPLQVYTEFPVVIQNSLRVPGQEGLFLLLDYYFPELRLAVELDSDYHKEEKDKMRDEYLEKLGITTWRITGLHQPSVQKKEFKELTKWMRERGKVEPVNFDFLHDIREKVRSENPIE